MRPLTKTYPWFRKDIKPLHRDEQIKAIERCVELSQKGDQEHLFLFGPSGSGKSFCVGYAMSRHKILSSYVDCRTYKTKMAILTRILIDLGQAVPRSGVASDYLYEKLESLLRKEKGTIIVLDDMHGINKKETEIFNDILRISDDSNGVSVIFIARNENVLEIDKKVLNMFLPIKINFPAYTKGQLMDILKQEADIPLDALEQIADFTIKHSGNCKLAMECLKRIRQRFEPVTLDCTLKFLNMVGY